MYVWTLSLIYRCRVPDIICVETLGLAKSRIVIGKTGLRQFPSTYSVTLSPLECDLTQVDHSLPVMRNLKPFQYFP